MTITGTRRPAKGFSLLEVLIAVVIMSVGLLALATLQIGIVRSSAEAKTQTIALNLALEKLEDLTSYRAVNKVANTCANDTSNDSYQCIDTGYDTVADSLGVFTASASGGSFTRTWTVSRFIGLTGSFTADGNNTADASTSTPRNEFKAILVDVSWTDAAGNTQHINVKDAVGTVNPGDAALISKKPIKLTPRYAVEQIYNPGSEAGVIPIAVGNGTNSAATNPKPEVIIGNSVVETRFDVLTYAGIVGDATVTAQSRVETTLVGCTCDFSTAPSNTSTIRGSRPTYWDGFRYVIPDTATYVPKAGVAAGVAQSAKCSVCCRDHHDPVNTKGVTFSPLKVAHPTVTTAHPHYYTGDGSTWTATSTGPYQEACRLIRVDGIFRVAPDLNNDYFGLLATGDGTSANTSVPDTTSVAGSPAVTGAVGRYQKFVIDYLDGRFTTPSAGSSQATYNTVGAVNTNANPYTLSTTAKYVLDNPTSIQIPLISTADKWLHSRGLYIDYLEQDAVDAINSAKDDPACVGVLSTCVLKLLPFTTVNLTEIADWGSADATKVTVTNNDFSTSISNVDPVRGRITSNASVAANPVNVTSYSRLSNTGLLDLSFNSISTTDNTKQTDIQAFDVTGGAIGGTKYVKVRMILPNPYATASGLPVNSINTPALNSYLQSTAATTYTCNNPTTSTAATTVSTPGIEKVGGTWYRSYDFNCPFYSGTNGAGLAVANALALQAKNYNFQYADPVTVTSNLTCTYGGINPNNDAVLAASTKTNSSPAAYTVNRCYDFALKTTSSSRAGVTTNNPGTVTSSTLKGETTAVNFSLIDENDVITLTYDNNTTEVVKAPVCTYTCDLNTGQTACKTGANANIQFSVGLTPQPCP